MDRYPDSPRDEIFTLTRHVTPARDREYIRDLVEGMTTVGRVLDSYKDENMRLRAEVDDLRERVYGGVASFDHEKNYRNSRSLNVRERRLAMGRQDEESRGRTLETEHRSVRSRSSIGVNRDEEEVPSPRSEAFKSIRPIGTLEKPSVGFEAIKGHYSGQRNYRHPPQQDRRRQNVRYARDVRDHTYSQELEPESAPGGPTRPIPDGKETRWYTWERRIPARDWKVSVAEYDRQTHAKNDHRNHHRLHLYDQDRDDLDVEPELPGHACDQYLPPEPHIVDKSRSISSDEKTIWQGHCPPSSFQTIEHPPSTSLAWERRETLDGLYYYYLNTKDGRMTDPQPIARDESEGEEFDLSRLRVTPQSPPAYRYDAPTASKSKDLSPNLPVHIPYRYKTIAALRDGAKDPVLVLGSASTNNPKPSKSSAESLPPSPRSSYRNSTLKPPENAQSVLPKPPIGVYNNRAYDKQFSSKKISTFDHLAERKATSRVFVPPARISASTTTSNTSEVFPPSPRSHYGYSQGQSKTSTHFNQPAKVTPPQQPPIEPTQQDSPRSTTAYQSTSNKTHPQNLHRTHLSSFEEAYGSSHGNYKVPFVNTVTDIDERERKIWSAPKVAEVKAAKKKADSVNAPSVRREKIAVPIRPRASTRGSGLGVGADGKRDEEAGTGREYSRVGKVKWTGSS